MDNYYVKPMLKFTSQTLNIIIYDVYNSMTFQITLVMSALNLYLIKSDFSYLLLIHVLWRLVIQIIRITLPLALSSIRITKPCILIARPYQIIKLDFNFDVCNFFQDDEEDEDDEDEDDDYDIYYNNLQVSCRS